MTQLADTRVALLDANVLFPFRKRDILLRFHHAGLFRARWTERILDEWTLNLLEQKPHLEPSVHSQRQAMREHFEEALVTGYEPLIGTLELPDADDRHVLAAAIRCGAQHIVTDNLVDFPAEVLGSFDIEAVNADGFLSRTFGTRSRPARTGRNPRTGEAVSIPASTLPTFKAGKTLKDAVNGGRGS